MPIYDYECPNCKYVEEFLEPFNTRDIHLCPDCQWEGILTDMVKVLSAPHIIDSERGAAHSIIGAYEKQHSNGGDE